MLQCYAFLNITVNKRSSQILRLIWMDEIITIFFALVTTSSLNMKFIQISQYCYIVLYLLQLQTCRKIHFYKKQDHLDQIKT